MTSEAAVIIAVVVLLSLFVAVAVVKPFKHVLIQKKHRDLHPLLPKMSIVGKQEIV